MESLSVGSTERGQDREESIKKMRIGIEINL